MVITHTFVTLIEYNLLLTDYHVSSTLLISKLNMLKRILVSSIQHGVLIFVTAIIYYDNHLEKILPEIKIEDIFKINLMILEMISEDPDTQIAGVVGIADFTGFEWKKHYQYLSPYYAKKSAEVVQVIKITHVSLNKCNKITMNV